MRRAFGLAIFVLVAAGGCKRPSGDVAPDAEAGQSSEEPRARALRRAALESRGAHALVRSLVDTCGPRPAGSPAAACATAWAARTMGALGLSSVRAEPVRVPRWERGAASGAVVSPTRQGLAVAALGGSVGTPEGGLEADVVAVPSLEALDALDAALVRGRWVLLDVPTERTRDGSGYGRAVGARWHGASRAARKGAVGVLVRSIGTDSNRLPHTGGMRYDDDAPRVPAAALSAPDADLVVRLLATGGPVRVRVALGCHALPDGDDANVVGEVPGAAGGEIVLLGAHLDSWDVGVGAVDDGAGCGAVLEAAHQLAVASVAAPLRRTVRVVLFAGEELGLSGARAYAAAHAGELARHAVALEADLGAGRVYGVRLLGDARASAAVDALGDLLAPLGVRGSHEPAEGGADLIPLREAGVPLIDLRQDATSYFDVHHTDNDTLDKVSSEDLAQVGAAFAVAALAAADAAEPYGRVPLAARAEK